MHTPSNTTPDTKQAQHHNYKQLYLQCKQNVAVFMQQVEQQITNIIQQHQKEKQQLQSQIKVLQTQLEQKKQLSHYTKSTASLAVQSTNHYDSANRWRQGQSSRQLNDLLSNQRSQNFNRPRSSCKNSLQSTRNSQTKWQNQKENNYNTSKLYDFQNNNSSRTQQNKPSSILAMRRAKKLKQIADSRMGENKQNITDLLKNIRQNQHNPQRQTKQQQQEVPIVKVVTPQMFSSAKTRAV